MFSKHHFTWSLAAVLTAAALCATAAAQDQPKPADDKPAVGQKDAKAPAAENDADDDAQAKSGKKSEITLKLGDAAPPLQVEKFLKGEPVKEFKSGHIYVVEFWATWCGPCRAAMPHLTDLQKKFKDKATFISVNVWEGNEYTGETLEKVEKFVQKNDERMGYTVAFDGGKKATDKAYLKAAGENGIPCAFVVGGDGKIAYIGHPGDGQFEKTLQQLIDDKFDLKVAIKAAEEKRAKEESLAKNQRKIARLMDEADELIGDGKYDEGIAKIDEAAKLMPEEMAPMLEVQKFTVLMQHDQTDKAYPIAKKLIEGPGKDDSSILNQIAWTIVDPEAKITKRDVALALKAAERADELAEHKVSAIIDTVARCYAVQGDLNKALELQNKAIEVAKKEDGMSDEQIDSLKESLAEYKKQAAKAAGGSPEKSKDADKAKDADKGKDKDK
jgi:thiol-disulfide isomerase/thioredoxin